MKSLGEIKKRVTLRKIKLEGAVDDIIKQLKQMGAIKIVLFGSFVSDRIGPGSDLDILVIMPNSKEGKDWLRQIYSGIERKVACDFFVFNEKQYRASKEQNFLLREIAQRGKVIYEKRI